MVSYKKMDPQKLSAIFFIGPSSGIFTPPKGWHASDIGSPTTLLTFINLTLWNTM